MSLATKWPRSLWLVRHGESAGNVARDEAEASGATIIQIATRDVDVPLSPLGERQARALGRWLARLDEAERPNVVLASPYLRARHTALLALEESKLDPAAIALVIDERLREREFGILDRLTRAGIEQLHPDQAKLRSALGKFYHRPPGGESWCDVILRLRNVIDTVTREYCDQRVLVVAHSVVVLCFRYLLENLTEEEILAVDRETDVANCAVTSYRLDPTREKGVALTLEKFNQATPLEEEGEPITTSPDVPTAPK